MAKEELKEIAGLIADKIPVEKIYSFNNEITDGDHLIILLLAGCGVKFTELEPFVKMVTSARKNITFTLYQASEVRTALKGGNLFFHITCVGQNLLYNKADSPTLPLPKAEELLTWKNEANAKFNDGIDKTAAFLEGAEFYYKKNEPGLTVFMLHQVFELTFRALELAIVSKEKKTHNISTHQSYIIPFAPQIGVLFPADTTEETEILKTLNNAYSAVRYEQNHKVDEKFIPLLFERVVLLQKRSKAAIDNLNTILDGKEKETLSVEETNRNELLNEEQDLQLPDAGNYNERGNLFFNTPGKLKEVIPLIIDQISPEQVYLFGSIDTQSTRSHLFIPDKNGKNHWLHYDLLAISSMPNPYSKNIQSIVNSIDGITVNLFIHSRDDVLKKIASRDFFFETVIRKGNLIYSKTTAIEKTLVPDTYNGLFYNKAEPYSTRRIDRAMAILQAVKAIQMDIDEVKLSLLAQSMEQACLGLIYSFLGYSPNLHSLPHLLNICKIFWPEDDQQFFPMKTPYDKDIVNFLSRSYSEMRYTVGEPIEADFEDLTSRCTCFIEWSEVVCFDKIEELKHKSNEITAGAKEKECGQL